MLSDRALLAFLVASLATSFVYLQMTSGLALHTHAAGLSTSDFGLLMALNGIVITCCELPLIAVTQRLPARGVMACGQLLIGIGFALTGLAHALTVARCDGSRLDARRDGQRPGRLGVCRGARSLAPAAVAMRELRASPGRSAPCSAPGIGGVLFGVNQSLLWLLCLALGIGAAALIGFGPHRRLPATEVNLEGGLETN